MKKYSEVSRRYAMALFELLGGKKTEDTLKQLRKVLAEIANPKLKNLLSSPVLSRQEKGIVIAQITASLSLDEQVEGLLSTMASKDRLGNFEEVVTCFEAISDEKNNVLRGEVLSAGDLSKSEKAEIEQAISKFTGYQLLLDYKKDPTLIGGITANVGSYTFDGSLNTQLMKLKEEVSKAN
jgi:F-type H+-transporting ATPase subunit delta